ncbi:22785_t:CDS:1, partial [Gigaspora margarita]
TPLLQTHTENPLENLTLSPVLQVNNEHLEFSVSPHPRSILTLAPEDLDNPENFAGPSQSLSLLPYDKDTTQVQFPPYNPLPSFPLNTIHLDQPLS